MALSKDDILNAIAEMSVMDIVELISAMEEKFGVTAAAAVAAAPAAAAGDATDTADWDDPTPGNLRADYALPSADWTIIGSGVLWPDPTDPLAETVATASRHRLVWVDLTR